MQPLFDTLLKGGAPAIRALQGQHETIELEFKGVAPPGRSGEREDKAVLAKALSAFANSMGGLIVWGVDCRKTGDGADEVVGFTPIEKLSQFASNIRDWTTEALMPRLNAVRVETIEETDDCGFLLILVDRSERRPHRAEFGQKYYYRRAGATSRIMEHFEIEDAFRRASVPHLHVNYRVEAHGSSHNNAEGHVGVTIHIALINDARVTANHVYVAISSLFAFLNISGQQERLQPPLRFFEASGAAIQPGISRTMAVIKISIPIKKQNGAWLVSRRSFPKTIAVSYGCADMNMKEEVLDINEADIISSMSPSPTVVTD